MAGAYDNLLFRLRLRGRVALCSNDRARYHDRLHCDRGSHTWTNHAKDTWRYEVVCDARVGHGQSGYGQRCAQEECNIDQRRETLLFDLTVNAAMDDFDHYASMSSEYWQA